MRITVSLLISFVFLCCTSCSNAQSSSSPAEMNSITGSAIQNASSNTDSSSQPQTTLESEKDSKEDSKMELDIEVGGKHLTATLADSRAAKELSQKFKDEPITVSLEEYGGFEKVGGLPWPLTKDDKQTDTEPGDIMLYQGEKMTIFYNSNSWSYTKLGHIENTTQEELKTVFGEGDVTVTLSLK